MEKQFLAAGSLFAFLGVVAGAFGSHVLKKYLNVEMLQVYETAVRYQMYHSLALILVALALKFFDGRWLIKAGWFFIAGIIIFSGSLYLLSFTGEHWLGAFTPFGGLSFLGGWICLICEAYSKEKPVKKNK